MLALSSGLLLSAWSIALFEHTPYLEPLPGSAGWTAMALLVLAAAGAGVLSAWQGCTLLMVPAAFVGLVDLSRTMFDSGVECEPFHPALLRGLVLVPIAVALGAVAARFSRALRAEALIGAVLLIGVPVAVFAWAGARHAAPIDREPAAEPRQPHSARFVITHPPLPALPSYRGLKDGDGTKRMLAVFGRPERLEHVSSGLTKYFFGKDVVWYASDTSDPGVYQTGINGFEVRDPRAATPEGAGIGDSLDLVSDRIPDAYCLVPLGERDTICETSDGLNGTYGYSSVRFYGDPIEMIWVG